MTAGFLIVLATPPLAAQEHEHAPAAGEMLGRVVFPTSCAADVQADFERAVAMLHSFWFEQAQDAFEHVGAADPDCAMAHWGIAMTLLGNPMARSSPPPERLQTAADAAERAASLAVAVTERERGYIDAVVALYRDHETSDHATRMKRHEEALKVVHERHPDDVEAAIFYARAIVANAPPSDLTFERQMMAVSIMEPLFAAQPDHPGLAHYLIHAFDAPAIAEQGLDAARRYASIAPAVPHALHMPSHIFTRLGYWEESIETNRLSADAEPNPDAAVHQLDYMVYAYLQLGQDAEAEGVVERSVLQPDRFYQSVVGYNFTAMPARLALERSRWAEAAELAVDEGAQAHVQAITRFARAVGASRSGRPDQAQEEIDALASLHQALVAHNDAYWATIVEAQRIAASAWLARARGDDAEAVRLARAGAELEETVEKHPVTPGSILPARELEGDLLLELERPDEALASYQKTFVREPRRARALFGAARAAELAGDELAARDYYGQLVELMTPESPREELARARAFLARGTTDRG
jgi:tetratricopeptide (TPR) repeat protein